MQLECPHCYTTVFCLADRICPACRYDVDEVAQADASKTALVVSVNERLPGVCCNCGRAADRFTAVGVSIRGDRSWQDHWIWQLTLGLLVGMWNSDCAIADARHHDHWVVRMPQCSACACAADLCPKSINSEQFTLTFVVDRSFARRVAAHRADRQTTAV